jgi:hypothetical protein
MEFASKEDIQSFLSRWLEEHGHNVYCQVPCPEGGEVDILTQDYVIACEELLSCEVILRSAEQIQAIRHHFPDQRPVVAGLMPEASEAELFQTIEQVKQLGIEVWFIDQMKPFRQYYRHLFKGQGFDADRVTGPALNRRNPLAGIFIAIGMAIILSLSFWVAYRILDRQQLQIASNSQESRAWDRMHSAVSVWDMDTTLESLEDLSESRNVCVAEFASRFKTSLKQNGPQGFRDINRLYLATTKLTNLPGTTITFFTSLPSR